jgi:hypothetical protein
MRMIMEFENIEEVLRVLKAMSEQQYRDLFAEVMKEKKKKSKSQVDKRPNYV